ncbi:PD-(D/E)XK nuclease family protein [Roseinatronobacter alkalisoli]|uniref:PD-(D/E)XK nuclease family protein n=1 Tax=Roseinatronobacter alkalisoli TaxID=3028235 RepID=A0ABT5T3X3_9RHOB|nr:PD-(D/E)XK nuclease family protein [Roseinatronobacter sp. HJB301]MDD7969822.1 PD-(D/E)XK nuclease family protein [Roseinatronobacter sp. HJB301]
MTGQARMFAPQTCARVFALPPGADFPHLLAQGLLERLAAFPPEARARVTVLVNSGRMQRRLRASLSDQRPAILPRIRLVSDPLTLGGAAGMPPPVPPLRRRLEIAQLVDGLLRADPGLAPRSALYDLSDSLARLFSEMQAEGVAFDALDNLDVSTHSGHWARALNFIRLVQTVITTDTPDPEGRLRAQTEALIAQWHLTPPSDPVLIAGSTGSRGTTALLMQAVARLPQGAVILPGYDFDMPRVVWDGLGDGFTSEDHPQFRFRRLMGQLDLAPDQITPWTALPAPAPARNRLVSLALRPAPVTDQWMSEGRKLQDLGAATAGMTLIEAPSPRMEAQAIAARLRSAIDEGKSAALVTPDRNLTRMVTVALDRWRIIPDDSAGRPLALSAPGRFLRHCAALMTQRLDAQALLTVLKHPLCHSAGDRGPHLLNTRNLELHVRRRAVAFPDGDFLRGWGGTAECTDWADWLAQVLPVHADSTPRPLAELVAAHLALAEGLAAGLHPGTGELWLQAAGKQAFAAMAALGREAPNGGSMTPQDYQDFVTAYLQQQEVREPVNADPRVMIWGTLEARVQGAELVILAGLNEGVWPKAPDPDPWLNRRMRADAGLLLPERQIGLSAHDFQQAIAAPEVVLSRAIRDAEAQTVPSRWLNRLSNLIRGLPQQGGTQAWQEMQTRGAFWLDMASAFDRDFRHIPTDPPAPRPAPAPPVAARPRELPVTAISRLIRDPFEIYAKYVLKLHKLNPLHPDADALLRGTVLHKVLEKFTKAPPEGDLLAQLLRMTDEVLASDVPWPAARALWRARMARAARAFLAFHLAQPGQIILRETKGAMKFDGLGFTLTAKPDRIDLWPDGRAHVIDYKTGTPPTRKQQALFDKQLLLQAVMVEAGAFAPQGPLPVARITYLGLGTTPKREEMDVTEDLNITTRDQFETLIRAYLAPDQGFAARRMLFMEREQSDYDHLSRYGEWTLQDAPVVVHVGQPVPGQGNA